MSTVTAIKSCATTACAYNHGGCTAFAITVGGHVGACQRLECVHNTDLMCTADAVTIGTDTATCLSYEPR